MSNLSDEIDEGYEKLREEARNDGMVLVFPLDNELQIDIDDLSSYCIFESQFRILEENFPGCTFEEHFSKSGPPKKHITVKLPFDVEDALERIGLQAALGSDFKRELLSLINHRRGQSKPTLFLERDKSCK